MNIELADEAKHDLRQLDKPTARRIIARLSWMRDNYASMSHVRLTGQWANYFKLRAGDYRILYEVLENETLIFVVRIRHRREVYR